MVPIKGEWTPFSDFEDQLLHYRLWGLIPPKSKKIRPIMVTDGYFGVPQPCSVVGYQGENWAVIELDDGYHAIHGEYLAELQPVAYQKLPFSMCFPEILAQYVVLDIETTGFDFRHDRIIEIAAITYEYGKRISEFHTLVNPGMLLPMDITELTGITQEDLMSAPELDEISDSFLSYIGSLPIVGHNAISFDIPFLETQLSREFTNPVIDTLPMARKVFDILPRHKLEYLNDVLKLESKGSHRALNDVETTNALMWACLSPRKYERYVFSACLNERMNRSDSPKKATSKKSPSRPSTSKFKKIDIKTIEASCDCIDQSHPLCGKNIVFTGELSIPREEAMQLAVDVGAILKTSISRKTAYLVVGQQDITLVGVDGMSSKEVKARELNESRKAQIQIINEAAFIALIKNEGNVDAPDTITEVEVYDILKECLADVILQNNVALDQLTCKEGKMYSSVWYGTQMAFRICCRDGHHYFGVSDAYTELCPQLLLDRITKDGRSDGFTNYSFVQNSEGILEFSTFLTACLDKAIDSLAKEFDCCSHYEQCSDAKRCVNPNPSLAVGCGYRRIMKQGRIFYGKNRNVN